MSNGRQVGRECRQIIAHTVVHEALAFPVEIMVVCNDGVARLGDKLSQCQPERQVDGNGECVLGDQRFKTELVCKLVEMLLEVIFQFLDFFCDTCRTDKNGEEILVKRLDLRMRSAALVHVPPRSSIDELVDGIDSGMAIKGFRNNVTDFLGAVTLAAEVKTLVPHPFNDSCPLASFERNTVRS